MKSSARILISVAGDDSSYACPSGQYSNVQYTTWYSCSGGFILNSTGQTWSYWYWVGGAYPGNGRTGKFCNSNAL